MASRFDLNMLPEGMVLSDDEDGEVAIDINGGLIIDLNLPATSNEHDDEANAQHHFNGQQNQNQQAAGGAPHHKPKNRLSTEKRYNLLCFLLQNADGEKLKKGIIKKAMELFNITRRPISRLWHESKKQKKGDQQVQPMPKIPFGREKENTNSTRINHNSSHG